MPMPPCELVFQVIESERNGENLEKLSMESTGLNMHYVIQIPCDFNKVGFAKVNLGRPPLEYSWNSIFWVNFHDMLRSVLQ